MGLARVRNEERHPGGQQSPSHLRESEEKERTPPECIDCPDGGPSKEEVDETEPYV